jgi:hypothetical protein
MHPGTRAHDDTFLDTDMAHHAHLTRKRYVIADLGRARDAYLGYQDAVFPYLNVVANLH